MRRVYDVSFHGSVTVSAYDEEDAYEQAQEAIENGEMEVELDDVECIEYDPNDPRI